MIGRRLPKTSVAILALVLACRDGQNANSGTLSAEPPSLRAFNDSPERPPRLGIAGIAQVADRPGSIRRGRDFAFDNCRPCHVVGPDQRSTTRFSVAPDFRSVANMPSTTPMSLIVWLTNPHPTMPSLILSPQEASDVIAYIESLRTVR